MAHNAETKAAVMAALLAGQAVTEVATAYKIDKSVVSRWRKQIDPDKLQQIATKKGDELDECLFGYLTANLKALKAQSHVAADETYLRRYPPQQLAVLHGVMADKAIRLLEVVSNPQEVIADAGPLDPTEES